MGIEHLEPKAVFKYFAEISAIPRGSGNELAISDYLMEFARERGLWAHRDGHLNVVIKKPGSAGYENAPVVILQGHMDMVCEKNRDTVHDFLKDGIKLVVDGDFLRADGTTLGADNGIAVAYGLALLDDNELSHPPVELLITADEEMGMNGAANLDSSLVSGRVLINLDSEEEGVFLASCAGGMVAKINVPTEITDVPDGYLSAALSVGKLNGGHSGSDIHKELANSNRILCRALCELGGYDFYISSIWGGAKQNAIPREAEAALAFKKEDFDKALAAVAQLDAVLKKEYRESDPEISLTLKQTDAEIKKAFTKETSRKLALAGVLQPNGVQNMCMSEKLAGIVETSLNLGVITTMDGYVEFKSALRSSVATRKRELADKLRLTAEVLGAIYEEGDSYPAWEFDPDSKLQGFLLEQYKAFTGKDARLTAIHAGLECGIFAEKLNRPDTISMGPDCFGAHTPDERASISSVARTWEFLKFALANMK